MCRRAEAEFSRKDWNLGDASIMWTISATDEQDTNGLHCVSYIDVVFQTISPRLNTKDHQCVVVVPSLSPFSASLQQRI
jgi:hypothetical protein